MTTPAIIERVRELRAELDATPDAPTSVPPPSDDLRKALDVIMLTPAEGDYASLRDQLLLAYAGFQVENPRLAGVMQGLIAELTAAGL